MNFDGTELQTVGDGAVAQGLAVGVAYYEADIVDAFVIHVLDGIAATAAHADDLDDTGFLLRHGKV